MHDLSEHAAIDATFYERDSASRHYCQRTNYRVQTLKVTKLVDTATQAVLDLVEALEEIREQNPVGWILIVADNYGCPVSSI